MAFFRENSRTLSAVLAANSTRVAVEGEEKQLNASFVTANYFRELGGTPILGRVLDPARDEASGAEPVVVLGHGYWQRHFGADPLVVGRTIRLNGKAATVVGVAAGDFSGLSLSEPILWAAVTQQPYFTTGSHLLTDFSVESAGVQMWGRLAPGQNPKAAEEELRSLAAELRKQHPTAIWEDERLPSEPGAYAATSLIGDRRGTGTEQRDPVYPIFALVGTLTLLILAVACGNLGSLLLARGVARQREIAIRVAIGAGNGRLIRQLFTESLLLAMLGSIAGLAVGYVVLRGLLVVAKGPAWLNAAPDWRVVVFALAAGFASAILFGLTPALQVGRQHHRAIFTRQVLIGAQVAASCVLMIVAGLLGRALDHATSTDPGFEYRQVVSIDPGLSRYSYSPARAQAYLDSLQDRLRAIPGVQSISLAISPPLGHVTISAGIDVDGRPVGMQLNRVDTRFFETMKIPLLRGRNLKPGDTHVAVISESMARLAWPGQDALGKTFTLGQPYTVVGICGSVRLAKFGDSDSVQAYLPVEPGDQTALNILVRTAASPQDLARAAVAAARAMDAETFPDVQLLSTAFRTRLEGAEYSAWAVSVLGFIAHLLACLGIVGSGGLRGLAAHQGNRHPDGARRPIFAGALGGAAPILTPRRGRPDRGLGRSGRALPGPPRETLRHQQFRSCHLPGRDRRLSRDRDDRGALARQTGVAYRSVARAASRVVRRFSVWHTISIGGRHVSTACRNTGCVWRDLPWSEYRRSAHYRISEVGPAGAFGTLRGVPQRAVEVRQPQSGTVPERQPCTAAD